MNARNKVPRPAPGTDVTRVDLTAEEGFVWSRVDGVLTVEEICAVTGLSEDRTLAILERLAHLGIIHFDGNGGREHRDDHYGASQRLATQPTAASGRAPDRKAQTRHEEATEPRREGTADEATPTDRSQGHPPVQDLPGTVASDFEPDDESELPLDLQRSIYQFWRSLDQLNFYQVLGVSQDADRKEILRAYKKRSRKFHPDRYYGKKLGRYQRILEEVFKHLTKVRDFLLDEDKRRAYDESLAEDQRLKRDIEAAMDVEQRALEQAMANGGAVPSPSSPSVQSSDPGVAGPAGPAGRPARPYRRRPSRLRLKALASVLGIDEQAAASQPAPAPSAEAAPGRRPRSTSAFFQRIARARTAAAAGIRPHKAKARRYYEEGLRKLVDGNFIGAATSLKLALTFDPGNEEFAAKYQVASERARQLVGERYYKQARFQESVGRWEAAAALYVQAAEQDPRAEYLSRAAEALSQTGDLKRAVECARKAVETDPQDVGARITLGKMYKLAGMRKNARRELSQALELDPENELAKTLLKEIRKNL